MRLGTKITFVIIAILAGWFIFSKTSEFLKEKYIYKFAANRCCVYAKKKWGADLYIGAVKGGILSDMSLRNISADRIKNLPAGLEIKADSLSLTYPPFGLLFGNFEGKFENLRIVYGDVIIPIDAYQREGMGVIAVKKNSIDLSKFSAAMPAGVFMEGVVNLEGELIFKKLKPHLLSISIDSKGIRVDCKRCRRVKIAFGIETSGKADSPHISGDVKVSGADIEGGFSFLSFFNPNSPVKKVGLKTPRIGGAWAGRSSMDIDIRGKGIEVRNRYLDADLEAALKLKKEKDSGPYVFGDMAIDSGAFRLYGNKCRITGGKVRWTAGGGSPSIDVSGETNVDKYKISVGMKGGEKPRLTLFSQPELPYSEIASLLFTGKELKSLTAEEKNRLAQADFNAALISNLFAF